MLKKVEERKQNFVLLEKKKAGECLYQKKESHDLWKTYKCNYREVPEKYALLFQFETRGEKERNGEKGYRLVLLANLGSRKAKGKREHSILKIYRRSKKR